jgi:hypothetical protein
VKKLSVVLKVLGALAIVIGIGVALASLVT